MAFLSLWHFTAYGVPKSTVSDNAKVVRSKAFYDFCFRWVIKRINTTPYYPQGSLAGGFENLSSPVSTEMG
jgi:hypothetical protein